MGAGKDPEAWEEWAANQKAADGRPAPHGKSLEQEVLKTLSRSQEYKEINLLKTPVASENARGRPERFDNRNEPDGRFDLSDQIAALIIAPQATDYKTEFVKDSAITWGKYEPAIRRWESLTRPAPEPTVPYKDKRRLNPVFVEWMMGLDEGHVTGHGLSAAKELKMLGNGIVTQQAREAFRQLIERKHNEQTD